MKCKKCGKDINCEELFCGNCGTKIDNCGLENTQNETFSNFNEITFGNQKWNKLMYNIRVIQLIVIRH